MSRIPDKYPHEHDTRGAQAVVEVLKKHGVEFIFYLCGTSTVPVAVEAGKAGIRIICTRQESTAAFAAKTVGRLTGVPGVVLVTSGPGLTNTITAVEEARADDTPMIIMSGAVQTSSRGIGDLQDIDQVGIMKMFCKASYSIENRESIVPTLLKAFQEAASNTPGPVYVQLPHDILEPAPRFFHPLPLAQSYDKNGFNSTTNGVSGTESEVPGTTEAVEAAKNCSPIPVVYQKASVATIKESVELIKNAKKPLLIIGTQVTLRPKKIGQISPALDDMGIPCFTLFSANGILPGSHKLLMRQTSQLIQAQQEADLVILAGVICDFTFRYGLDLPGNGAPIISVNRSLEKGTLNAGKFWKLGQYVQSDVGYYLVHLARELKKISFQVDQNWISNLRDRNTEYEAFLNKKEDETLSDGHVNPLYILKSVNRAVNRDVIWVFDQGDFVNTASFSYIRPETPLSWIDSKPIEGVGGSAGYALGAKLCFPDREVWCIAGDGSCGFTVIEFDTFRRHNVNVTFLIGNDGRFSEICRREEEEYGTSFGCTLEFSKYHEVVTALGGAGFLIEKIKRSDFGRDFEGSSDFESFPKRAY